MNRLLCLVCVALFATSAQAGDKKLPAPFVTGLKNPESVAVGLDGRIYVTEIGEFNKAGDGRVVVVDKDGKITPFATGLDDPKGMVVWTKYLFVADNKRIWKIDEKGKAEVFVPESAFPIPPLFLNDLAVDEKGVLYVSDSGDLKGNGGAVFRIEPIEPKGKKIKEVKKDAKVEIKVSIVIDPKRYPALKTPNGVVLDGRSFLLMLDFGSGDLLRINIADGSTTKLAGGFDGGDGLAWDLFGRLYISSWKTGKMWVIPRPGEQPIAFAEGFKSAADICLDPNDNSILVPDMLNGTLTKLPSQVPGQPIDDKPLPVKTDVAFPNLQFTGWKAETDAGKVFPLRPLILTHAGDGSHRNFVAIQQGTIHVFPNDPKADKTKIFLDIEKKVYYNDKENEQGLLGLVFHPKYKENGEFFVFYTLKQDKTTNILARFRVSKDDPNRADAATEEEIIRFQRPFWNHDGGTICFGPDGYLYLTTGDGGAFDDPKKNGQNLNTLLAKVLRIDIDHKDAGKNYAVPKDNPFVGRKDALPEIWAYGLRNIWRMAFDRKTGKLWASDVGQNLYEEIDIIVKGGNYGWSLREGLHPFSVNGVGPNKDMIEPIWEYHHALGKSLTGGLVYRGKEIPELAGLYVYGDFITNKLWGHRYDDAQKRVVANRPIPDTGAPVMSFGEDERGEIYLLTTTVSNRGILKFVRDAK